MLLIALSGGRPAERVEIADRLISSGKGQFAAYAQATPSADYALRRVQVLRTYIEGPAEGFDKPSPVEGMVVVHCLSDEEATEIRSRGGVIWHLYSKPSDDVCIKQGDVMVTKGEQGFRHVRTPLEALSELVLARLAANQCVRSTLKSLSRE